MVDHLKDIKGSFSNKLLSKRICLCITGSIAAIKCVELARLLMRHGAEILTVMSPAAQEIIHPYAMEWATGNPVLVKITGRVEHVELAGESNKRVDAVLLAPATANTIGKIVSGIDDTPVTTVITTALGSKVPIIVVPVMNELMSYDPFIKRNLELLESTPGVFVVRPVTEENKAKMMDMEDIVDHVIRKTVPSELADRKVLITTGPNREYIDSVRFLSTPSSGKTGIELARQAWYRGAEVELIIGPSTVEVPKYVRTTRITSANDMLKAVERIMNTWCPDVVIKSSAVSDFTPETEEELKIKSGQHLTLTLKPTAKIIDRIKEINPNCLLVGYKAETGLSEEELFESARELIEESKADFIVANYVAKENAGFSQDKSKVFFVTSSTSEEFEGEKAVIADKIIQKISNALKT
ncbi:MAG: bifunctional phosphopantothenoylcysteine decarboxylase/phosphopantothenate--cysteine ligase CoaBC [Candidatus Odinarchaeota archaeon]